eukprot:898374_1
MACPKPKSSQSKGTHVYGVYFNDQLQSNYPTIREANVIAQQLFEKQDNRDCNSQIFCDDPGEFFAVIGEQWIEVTEIGKNSKKRQLCSSSVSSGQPPSKKRKLKQSDRKKRKINIKESTDKYKGVPDALRKFEFLYLDCDELTDENRSKIIRYMTGKYTKDNAESEDILLSIKQDSKHKTKSIFRMLFKTKKWKRIKLKCIKKN